VSEYAVGQTVRLRVDVELDDDSRAYAGETAMIVGFVGQKVVLDYIDADTGEHVSGDAQPWELERIAQGRDSR
jgi:hypothetical protein